MKRLSPLSATAIATATATAALAFSAMPVFAQAKVPVMALAPSAAQSMDNFGAILGVRQLPSGGVLVNDAGRRRLVLLDKSLGNATVVIDSTAGAARGP
jgi:hypothetical protein